MDSKILPFSPTPTNQTNPSHANYDVVISYVSTSLSIAQAHFALSCNRRLIRLERNRSVTCYNDDKIEDRIEIGSHVLQTGSRRSQG